MPLKTCKSKKVILEKRKELKKEGKQQKQATDIAISKARKGRKK